MSSYLAATNSARTPAHGRYSRSGTPILTLAQPTVEEQMLRLAPLTLTENVEDIINLIPTTYRASLRPVFMDLHSRSVKFGGLESQLLTLRQEKAAGKTFSALAGLKAPSVQLTKEFTIAKPTEANALHALFAEYKSKAHEKLLEIKELEKNHLAESLKYDFWYTDVKRSVERTWTLLKEVHGSQIERSDPSKSGVIHPFEMEKDGLLYDLVYFGQRTVEIARSRNAVELTKKLAKQAIKANLDTEMADVNTSTISDAVNKQVAAALKKAGVGKGNNIPHSFQNTANPYNSSNKRQREGDEETFPSKRQKESTGENRETEKADSQVRERRKAGQQRTEEEVIRGKNFPYSRPDTWPDTILKLNTDRLPSVLIPRIPIFILEGKRSVLPGCHVQAGVFLPNEFRFMLGAGLRFLFWRHGDFSLVDKAWSSFVNSTRWHHYFSQFPSREPFNPLFKSSKEGSLDAPHADPITEYALCKGKQNLLD